MKTLDEVIVKMKEIEVCFPEETNSQMRNCLKIDLFMDVPDNIFYEALRQIDTNANDFRSIQCTRNFELSKNKRLYTYNKIYSNKRNNNSIIALFYDSEKQELSYVCFKMGDKSSIEKYLISSNGKAISYVPKNDCRYWMLNSSVNGSFLLFRQDTSGRATDIDNSEIDLKQAQYLATL